MKFKHVVDSSTLTGWTQLVFTFTDAVLMMTSHKRQTLLELQAVPLLSSRAAQAETWEWIDSVQKKCEFLRNNLKFVWSFCRCSVLSSVVQSDGSPPLTPWPPKFVFVNQSHSFFEGQKVRDLSPQLDVLGSGLKPQVNGTESVLESVTFHTFNTSCFFWQN